MTIIKDFLSVPIMGSQEYFTDVVLKYPRFGAFFLSVIDGMLIISIEHQHNVS